MASSMQEYLKRYASDVDNKSQGKKRKKKMKTKSEASMGKRQTKSEASMGKRLGIGLSIVDADPVWQKELKEESSESEDEQEDAPLIIKDVEFQRLQRLEALRSRPYLAMADDGSGWVEVKENQKGEYSRSQEELASTKESKDVSTCDDTDLSPIRRSGKQNSIEKTGKQKVMADGTAAGLKSGRQLADEIDRKKLDDSRRYKELDASITGRHANTVYRDKHGRKLESFEEMLKLQQGGEPMKEEKVLEWGQGLVQKREAEARLAELEAEKSKPFARTRDDPELDKHLREQVRWGDPMAHLVKNKATEPVLEDLGAREQMQESGFVVPQAVPKHSWLKRGITQPSNRYGIKPGRHWDGVDRSTGFERDMFKRQNEKAAERLEAYLWSVADM